MKLFSDGVLYVENIQVDRRNMVRLSMSLVGGSGVGVIYTTLCARDVLKLVTALTQWLSAKDVVTTMVDGVRVNVSTNEQSLGEAANKILNEMKEEWVVCPVRARAGCNCKWPFGCERL